VAFFLVFLLSTYSRIIRDIGLSRIIDFDIQGNIKRQRLTPTVMADLVGNHGFLCS
jgi:hypothetical protein